MIDEAMFGAEEKMDKAVSVAKEDFSSIRTGRATPQMFNKILVDYYGAPTPINQLASFQTPEARMILISPFDKGSMHSIEKAIRDSDLGVNPVDDGHIIRVVLPVLTEERRKEYIKMAKHKAEEARVSIRNIRRHTKDHLERLIKDGDAGEDDVRRAEKSLEDLTARHIAMIEDLLKHKESELLEI
jgi:ribosome recycling factor